MYVCAIPLECYNNLTSLWIGTKLGMRVDLGWFVKLTKGGHLVKDKGHMRDSLKHSFTRKLNTWIKMKVG